MPATKNSAVVRSYPGFAEPLRDLSGFATSGGLIIPLLGGAHEIAE